MQLVKSTLGFIVGILVAFHADAAVIDFGNVPSFTSVPLYLEDGFELTTNFGDVQINDAFGNNNAAQPSFGFVQGFDSKFIFKHTDGLQFKVTSIDLLEAAVSPEPYSIVATGFRSNGLTVLQTFLLDGISGAQTFFFDTSFQELQSLEFSENTSNSFNVDIVQIDNLVATAVPEPSEALLMMVGLSILVGGSRYSRNKAA